LFFRYPAIEYRHRNTYRNLAQKILDPGGNKSNWEVYLSEISPKASGHRLGKTGAILTIVGTLLSGPISILVVSLVQAQPPWESAGVFVENFHRIQTLPFYLGFLLIIGSILIIASIYQMAVEKSRPLLGLIFTSIAGGLIFFNYLIQTTVIPVLVKSYSPEFDPIISTLSMSNPESIPWAIEMWGYGFLGLGTWLTAGFFTNQGIEKVTRILFIANGVLSIIGALWTSFDLGWVLSTAGLISFGGWNLLYIILALLYYFVLKGRQTAQDNGVKIRVEE
jgi:hypothetical protein